MQLDDVLIIMEAEDILTTDNVRDIKAVIQGEHSGKRIERFLDILINHKTNRAFTSLLVALDKTEQPFLSNLLK